MVGVGLLLMVASATAVRVVRRHVAGFRGSQDLLVAVMLPEVLDWEPSHGNDSAVQNPGHNKAHCGAGTMSPPTRAVLRLDLTIDSPLAGHLDVIRLALSRVSARAPADI